MLHDLLIAVAFVAMVAAPAMVATLGGKKEYEPEPEPETEPRIRSARPSGHLIHPHSTLFVAPVQPRMEMAEANTLPMRARGMMNR